MRYEALGQASDGKAYYFFLDPDVDPILSLWIFSDSSAITLAAHVKKHDKPIAPPSPKPQATAAKGKKSPAKKSPAKKVAVKEKIVPCHVQPDYSGCWKVEARGLDECRAVAAGFASSKQECEMALGAVIESQVIKAAERRLAEQELARKREARVQVRACVCASVCVLGVTQRFQRELALSSAAAPLLKRERKKINYDDDAFNILDAAVEVERRGGGSRVKVRVEEEVGALGVGGRPTRSAAKHASQVSVQGC